MKQHDRINEQRAREIIQAYGASPQAWPAVEREDVLSLIDTHPALQHLLENERFLDRCMASDNAVEPIDARALARRILDALPEPATRSPWQWIQQQLSLHMPVRSYAMAGLATVFIISALVLNLPQPDLSSPPDPVFEQWVWYDVTRQDLTEETPVTELGFMDLVDLEVSDS